MDAQTNRSGSPFGRPGRGDDVGFSYKGTNKPGPRGFDYNDDVEGVKNGAPDLVHSLGVC